MHFPLGNESKFEVGLVMVCKGGPCKFEFFVSRRDFFSKTNARGRKSNKISQPAKYGTQKSKTNLRVKFLISKYLWSKNRDRGSIAQDRGQLSLAEMRRASSVDSKGLPLRANKVRTQRQPRQPKALLCTFFSWPFTSRSVTFATCFLVCCILSCLGSSWHSHLRARY